MRLTRLHVDHFGAWTDFTLPVSESGLTLVYGRNETGKSTLMRFIRGVLHGFPTDFFARRHPSDHGGRIDPNSDAPTVWSGSLEVTHRGESYDLKRVAEAGERGRLSFHPLPAGRTEVEWHSELLGGTGRSLYESVFALGLSELQELSVLESDEVARHIYHMSLGSDGGRLGDLLAETRDTHDPPEQLARLRERETELTTRLGEYASDRDRYDNAVAERSRLREERRRLDAEFTELETRRNRWQRLARLKPAFDRYWLARSGDDHAPSAEPIDLPDDGLETFDRLQTALADARQTRDDHRAEARRLAERAEGTPVPTVPVRSTRDSEETAILGSISELVGQRAAIERLEQNRERAIRRHERAVTDHQTLKTRLGDRWADDILDRADLAPGSLTELLGVAGRYRSRVLSRDRLRKKYDRYSEKYNTVSATLSRTLAEIGEAGSGTDLDGGTIGEAIARRYHRIALLRELAGLMTRLDEYDRRERTVREEVHRIDIDDSLPSWVNTVLTIFIVVGLFVAVMGYIRERNVSFWAGLLYCLLGLTGVGILWGVQSWLRGREESVLEERLIDQRSISRERGRLEDRLGEIAVELGDVDENGDYDFDFDWTERLDGEIQGLSELHRLSEREDAVNRLRKGLSELRRNHQARQRAVTAARDEWVRTVKKLGLPETARTKQAFADYETLALVIQSRRELREAAEDATAWNEQTAALRSRLVEISERLGEELPDNESPVRTIDRWAEFVDEFAETDREPTETIDLSESHAAFGLWRDVRDHHEAADEEQRNCDRLAEQIRTLLLSAGASNRDELARRYEASDRSADGHRSRSVELAEAEAAWNEIRREVGEPIPEDGELRLVDHELIGTEIERIVERLAEVEAGRTGLTERESRLARDLQSLAEDRSELALRRELETVRAEIAEQLETWWATRLAAGTLAATRDRLEDRSQPEVLRSAGRYLSRMTRGGFDGLWADPERHAIGVTDGSGRSWEISHLSGGTREQVFLALRLAIIDRLADDGIDLPVILDDVLVNFDHERTIAVMETLIDFAENGRQVVLFTCHEHLVPIVERRGHMAVSLPNRSVVAVG